MSGDLDFFDDEDGRVSVLLPLGFGKILDYRFSGKRPQAGSFVSVPLGSKTVVGVVWQKEENDKGLQLKKLKPVYQILRVPRMSPEQQKFVDWVSDYTLSAPGNVLKMSMSVPDALKKLPVQTLYRKSSRNPDPARLTEKRLQVLAQLIENNTYSVAGITKITGASQAVVRGMIKPGLLEAVERLKDRPYEAPDPSLPGPGLTDEQKTAVEGLKARLGQGFQAIALEGVTGSGKTEVYFEAIAEVLEDPDVQVLVLLPEIALTNQWLERFDKRFGARPVEWHSDLGKAERRRAWRAVIAGEARVVVGARSALFLPFQHLSLIVADEEHDPSFKQEEGVPYHARDMAVVRAHLGQCPVILSSATLSYETLFNIERERYSRVTLTKRYGGAKMPGISGIDMKEEKLPSSRWLSEKLVSELKKTLTRGEQGMLFLNRRGYAPLTLCRTCGTRIECPDCTAWLVEHRLHRRLMCHHCGYSVPKPKHCPECGDLESLAVCGPGVERLEEEVAALFPEAKRLVMTSDTLTSPARAAEMVAKIATGETDIIIGTQVITKGYHFPKLTLVGVIDADLGLKGGDLRAAERTYQQIEQVAGRAGREELPGHVYIQTFMPENPVMAALLSGVLKTQPIEDEATEGKAQAEGGRKKSRGRPSANGSSDTERQPSG